MTLSDKKLGQAPPESSSFTHYLADVRSAVDYYPFGMQMPGRSLSGGYRWGFNGKELDNEVKGVGNSLDFGARIYDSRLGRWLSLDPLFRRFPWESHFCYAGNNSILFIDVDGKYKYPKNRAADLTKKYPILTIYLSTQVKIDVSNSPILKAALEKFSGGNLNSDALKTTTSWGSGPNVNIVDNPGGLYGANGYYDNATGTIQISTALANQLEKASLEDREAALYGLFVTLLHETVHYGDYLDGKRQTSEDLTGFGGEPGDAFAREVFYSKTLKVEGKEIKAMQVQYDHTNINDAKEMIKMNNNEGNCDVIPTLPILSANIRMDKSSDLKEEKMQNK